MQRCTEELTEALRLWMATPAAQTVAAHCQGGQLARLTDVVQTAAVAIPPQVRREWNVAARAIEAAGGTVSLGRWLLVQTALAHAARLDRAPIAEGARRHTCAELRRLTDAAIPEGQFTAGTTRFGEWARLATGRRFAAGLFQWEYSGVPLTWLRQTKRTDLGRVLRALVAAGGRRPMLVTHLAPPRPQLRVTAAAVTESYLLMAETLELDPTLRGIAGASWLRSPETHRVSPRLACINQVILEGGGVVATLGPAPEDCGVLSRSATRRRLFQQGAFRPTIGMIVWPRAAAIMWRRHRLDGLGRLQASTA